MVKQKNTAKLSICEQCQIRKEAPLYNAYNPRCIMCGAYGIKALQRLDIERSAKTARLRTWLTGYVNDGHDEQELRRLAKT